MQWKPIPLLMIFLLAGCGMLQKKPAQDKPPQTSASAATPAPGSPGAKRQGAYYQDDGPGDKPQ